MAAMTTSTNSDETQGSRPATAVENLTAFASTDLHDLCDAAESAIAAGGGFGWLTPPPRQVMESYWKGVLLVPERELFVARLDQTICGSAQLQRAPRNNEAQALSGNLTTSFMAPWARGHGLARMLVLAVEEAARAADLRVLNLDVRESQDAAIKLYESLGYQLWGRHPHYARIGEQWVTGLYYFKDLRASANERV
jgi:ribosomal protein S18 acetylase RimI-like enzyme